MTMVMMIVMTCKSGMRAPAISTGRLKFDHRSIDFGRLEKSISKKCLMTKPKAKEAIIIVAGLALRKRRKTRTSETTERPAPIARMSGMRMKVGRLPAKTTAAASIDGQSMAKTQKEM